MFKGIFSCCYSTIYFFCKFVVKNSMQNKPRKDVQNFTIQGEPFISLEIKRNHFFLTFRFKPSPGPVFFKCHGASYTAAGVFGNFHLLAFQEYGSFEYFRQDKLPIATMLVNFKPSLFFPRSLIL